MNYGFQWYSSSLSLKSIHLKQPQRYWGLRHPIQLGFALKVPAIPGAAPIDSLHGHCTLSSNPGYDVVLSFKPVEGPDMTRSIIVSWFLFLPMANGFAKWTHLCRIHGTKPSQHRKKESQKSFKLVWWWFGYGKKDEVFILTHIWKQFHSHV